MKTGPVTASPGIHPDPVQATVLSGTDFKVYAKVVLSYMLIGIGLALACSIPFIAFTVSPMFAAASPVTPLAFGILLQSSNEPEVEIQITPPPPVQTLDQFHPIGIINDGQNCWLNSSLQLLFNVQAFETAVKNLDLKKHPEVAFIKQAYEKYKKGQDVGSAAIRVAVSRLFPVIDASTSQPEDPVLFLDPFLRRTGYVPMEEYCYIVRKGEEGTSANRQEKSDTVLLDLSHYYDKDKNSTLSDMLNNYFYKQASANETFIHSVKTPPNDISISTQFYNDHYQLIKTPIKESMEITISAENFGQETGYVCDGFITHIGSSPTNGHYKAYLNKNGKWWEMDDEKPAREISFERASSILATAHFRHYQRLPS